MLRPAVTLDEHRPPQHRAAARLTPEAVREKVATIGGALRVLSDKIFLAADHPNRPRVRWLGFLRLVRSTAPMRWRRRQPPRLPPMCIPTLMSANGWSVAGRLSAATPPAPAPALHENVRGSAYYH